MQVKSIVIFGDSWALTSFKKIYNPFNPNIPFEEEPTGLNFQNLFAEHGIDAQNFSKGGNSNKGIVLDIETNKSKILDCDLVLICQTDPVRDVIHKNTYKLINDRIEKLDNVHNLENFAEQMLCDFYNQLSKIQQEIQKKFLIIAGISKVFENCIPKNLNYIAPCWTKITVKDFEHDSYFGTWDTALIVNEFLEKKFKWDFDVKADFLRIETDISSRQHLWQTNDNFAWVHPSDGAYQKMFGAIIEKIGEIDDNS